MLGLCGGYQMLGRRIHDWQGLEGQPESVDGLGLLDVETTLEPVKALARVSAIHVATNTVINGYEIHLGRTSGEDCARPFAMVGAVPDGAISRDGRVAGTYIHGCFESDAFRQAYLTALGGTPGSLGHAEHVERTLDALAEHLDGQSGYRARLCHCGAGERGLMLSTTLSIAFAALVIERLAGYPKFIHDGIGHPVEWIGAVIGGFEEALNHPDGNRIWQKFKGAFALFLTLVLVAILTIPFSLWLRHQEWGWLLEAVLATTLLAQFDLYRHVRAVYAGLETSLDDGRRAVSRIVGRDPDQLDESGVTRAAIESLAENASDAVIAPALFLALFGLPGIAAYKVINTADSMIGHKSPRFIDFGWASARLDDLVNLIPARLSGLLFAGAASLTNPGAGADAWPACGTMPASTCRPMPAGPRRRWPARSTSASAGRATMTACRSTSPGWAMAGSISTATTSAAPCGCSRR